MYSDQENMEKWYKGKFLFSLLVSAALAAIVLLLLWLGLA